MNLKKLLMNVGFFVGALLLLPATSIYAHCDSYAGPVIKDAEIALENKKVDYILKWIDKEQEREVITLFDKTIQLQDDDREVYQIVKKHFLETLVRLHRETEGEPFTGLHPDEAIPEILVIADQSLENADLNEVLPTLIDHFKTVLEERFDEAARLYKLRNDSVELGREYVVAYVNYVHTIEAVHHIIENAPTHSH